MNSKFFRIEGIIGLDGNIAASLMSNGLDIKPNKLLAFFSPPFEKKSPEEQSRAIAGMADKFAIAVMVKSRKLHNSKAITTAQSNSIKGLASSAFLVSRLVMAGSPLSMKKNGNLDKMLQAFLISYAYQIHTLLQRIQNGKTELLPPDEIDVSKLVLPFEDNDARNYVTNTVDAIKSRSVNEGAFNVINEIALCILGSIIVEAELENRCDDQANFPFTDELNMMAKTAQLSCIQQYDALAQL